MSAIRSTAPPSTASGYQRIQRIVAAVGTPMSMAALAYGLWFISDRLLYIGPLDRAAFGWAIVVPVWLLAPVATGLAWHRLPQRRSTLIALPVATVVGGAAAVLFWAAVAFPDCQYGAVRTSAEWILPSLVLGLVVGGGLSAASLWATSLFSHRHPLLGFVAGAGSQLAFLFVAIFVAVLPVLAMGGACQRPPLT